MLWGVKNVKILHIACVQAVGHSFFQIFLFLYFVHELVGMTSHQTIFFVGLGSISRSLLKINITLNSRMSLIFSIL